MEKEEKKQRNKRIMTVAILLILVVSLFAFVIMNNQQSSQTEGEVTTEFAACLVNSGAKMYGAWWCPHCNDQKKAFGDAWQIMLDGGAYVECAKEDKSQNQVCADAKIEGYPTWRFANGHELYGFIPYESFVEETGCTME